MKIRKIITGIVLAIASVLTMGVLASCGGGNTSSSAPANSSPVADSSTGNNDSTGDSSTPGDSTSPFASLSFSKTNVHLTSIGQGDFTSANQLVKRAIGEDNFKANATLNAEEVSDGATVIIVIGASGKGLGEAGTDITKEEARANAFVAKKDKINIVAIHLGGVDRRGVTSDPSIRTVAGAAKAVMVVEGGNNDGLFDSVCGTTIPMQTYERASGMVGDITALFE